MYAKQRERSSIGLAGSLFFARKIFSLCGGRSDSDHPCRWSSSVY